MVSYVIVDEVARAEFEKYFQLPYGYSQCIIFDTFKDAYEIVDGYHPTLKKRMIIERWESGEREIVYPEYITE
jgi:hypothetical protein